MLISKGTKTPSYRKRLGYQGGLLGGMGFLASIVLIIADIETRASIEAALIADQKATLAQVLPSRLHNNEILQDTLIVSEPNGQHTQVYLARQDEHVVGAAFKREGFGYAGVISLMMAVDHQGEILGVRVLSHSETPGLGDKIEAEKSDWILSFNGLSLHDPAVSGWRVKKDGGHFDQFSGATITPRAVVKTVRAGLEFFAHHRTQILQAPPPPLDELAMESSHHE